MEVKLGRVTAKRICPFPYVEFVNQKNNESTATIHTKQGKKQNQNMQLNIPQNVSLAR